MPFFTRFNRYGRDTLRMSAASRGGPGQEIADTAVSATNPQKLVPPLNHLVRAGGQRKRPGGSVQFQSTVDEGSEFIGQLPSVGERCCGTGNKLGFPRR